MSNRTADLRNDLYHGVIDAKEQVEEALGAIECALATLEGLEKRYLALTKREYTGFLEWERLLHLLDLDRNPIETARDALDGAEAEMAERAWDE